MCEEITKFSRRNRLGVKSLKGLTLLSKPRAHTDHTSSNLIKHNQKHHSGDRGVFVKQKPMVQLECVVFFMETARYKQKIQGNTFTPTRTLCPICTHKSSISYHSGDQMICEDMWVICMCISLQNNAYCIFIHSS